MDNKTKISDYHICAAAACIRGDVRNNNEDNYLFQDEYLPENHTDVSVKCISSNEVQCMAVFDGMGGEQCGETASWLAASSLKSYLDTGNVSGEAFLEESWKAMQQKVLDYKQGKKIRHMGTTVVSLYFDSDQIYGINIGDSRIYRIRNDRMEQLSVDHVVTSPYYKRRMLAQFLGLSPEESEVVPDVFRSDYCTGDKYILCSDGVTDMMTDKKLSSLVTESAEESVQNILGEVHRRGAEDNATVIVAEVEEDKISSASHWGRKAMQFLTKRIGW